MHRWVWPSHEVVTRQSIFLALAGRREEAVALLEHGLRTFSNRRRMITETIASAPGEAHDTLQPVLNRQPGP